MLWSFPCRRGDGAVMRDANSRESGMLFPIRGNLGGNKTVIEGAVQSGNGSLFRSCGAGENAPGARDFARLTPGKGGRER